MVENIDHSVSILSEIGTETDTTPSGPGHPGHVQASQHACSSVLPGVRVSLQSWNTSPGRARDYEVQDAAHSAVPPGGHGPDRLRKDGEGKPEGEIQKTDDLLIPHLAPNLFDKQYINKWD